MYPARSKSESGKLAITHFTSLLWQTPGIYLAEAPAGRVDLAVSGVAGKHVMLECQVNPTKKDMVLTLSRDSGPTLQKTLAKKGHQFVSFGLPNAPESFDFSLTVSDPDGGMVSGTSWVFYGCDMELK